MADDTLQRIWRRFVSAAKAASHETFSGETNELEVPEGSGEASLSARFRLEFYVRSKTAEIAIPVTTMRFKTPPGERVIKGFEEAIVRQLNYAHDVNDFEIMRGKEVDAYILGCHPLNPHPLPGEPNISGKLPN